MLFLVRQGPLASLVLSCADVCEVPVALSTKTFSRNVAAGTSKDFSHDVRRDIVPVSKNSTTKHSLFPGPSAGMCRGLLFSRTRRIFAGHYPWRINLGSFSGISIPMVCQTYGLHIGRLSRKRRKPRKRRKRRRQLRQLKTRG